MNNIVEIANYNQKKAWEVVKQLGIIEAWEQIGAKVNLVGSLQTKLLMTHRDIDFHVYTDNLSIGQSFEAISKIAQHPSVKEVKYNNLLDADDTCLEWHVWCEDDESNIWQIDIMHIVKDSKYDGFFEKVADKIKSSITEEQRASILRLKYDTPENIKIMGVEYYVAVISFGIKDYKSFAKWREENPDFNFMEWFPE